MLISFNICPFLTSCYIVEDVIFCLNVSMRINKISIDDNGIDGEWMVVDDVDLEMCSMFMYIVQCALLFNV